jgi:hypothetical protein
VAEDDPDLLEALRILGLVIGERGAYALIESAVVENLKW